MVGCVMGFGGDNNNKRCYGDVLFWLLHSYDWKEMKGSMRKCFIVLCSFQIELSFGFLLGMEFQIL